MPQAARTTTTFISSSDVRRPRAHLHHHGDLALAPGNAASRAKLENVRDTYMNFFTDLPGTGYDFFKPPIPVEIGGSLFFDMSHATGGRPGPQDLRPDMPVVWEVHP